MPALVACQTAYIPSLGPLRPSWMQKKSSSISRISSYLSVVNSGHAKAISTGVAESGSWNSDISDSKIKGQNENAASYAAGEISGYVEANGEGDAANIPQ